MLLKRCALPMHATVDARVGCRWRDGQATEQLPGPVFGNVTREKAPAAGSIERRGGRTRSIARVGTPIELSLQWMENREAWADEPTSDHLCSEDRE